MADGEDTLADRWMRGIKNNPIVAGMIVLGALVAIAGPVWTPLQRFIFPAPREVRPSIDVKALMTDRDHVLVPVRNALRENKAVYDRLSGPLYNEPGWGVQESYYERVKREGPEKHELMRGMIDSLVMNNKKIMDLLDTYVGRARTGTLKKQEALFREHARLYAARWTGMKEAAVSGEKQPIAEPVFPASFPSSLDAEIEAVEKLIVAGSSA